jgi:hypothetical protein
MAGYAPMRICGQAHKGMGDGGKAIKKAVFGAFTIPRSG